MDKIIIKIRNELKNCVDEKSKAGFERFFKEPIKYYGVKVPLVRKIAMQYWKEVKNLDKKETFDLCETLLQSDYSEEAFIVCYWLPKIKKSFEESDLIIFERWINSYINNWAKCDSFCNHTVGDYIDLFPHKIGAIKKWSKSKNKWLKRASAVSLILPARRGKLLDDVFEIADNLLMDPEDLVQKGYGWMLKEASRLHQKEVLEYVLKNKDKMPRTALRYAIELMPENLRKKAMEK